MFHDQGLPVLKRIGFGRAVNITLRLPIIRTSVDHGTALDLAGSGSMARGPGYRRRYGSAPLSSAQRPGAGERAARTGQAACVDVSYDDSGFVIHNTWTGPST